MHKLGSLENSYNSIARKDILCSKLFYSHRCQPFIFRNYEVYIKPVSTFNLKEESYRALLVFVRNVENKPAKTQSFSSDKYKFKYHVCKATLSHNFNKKLYAKTLITNKTYNKYYIT